MITRSRSRLVKETVNSASSTSRDSSSVPVNNGDNTNSDSRNSSRTLEGRSANPNSSSDRNSDSNNSSDSKSNPNSNSIEVDMSDDRVLKEHLFEGNHYAEWRYVLNIGLRKADLFDFVTDYNGLVMHRATAAEDRSRDPY